MRSIRKILTVLPVFVLILALIGCKSQDELDNMRDQQASKSTQEIVIKQETAKEHYVITVTGKGEVSVDPDVATVRLAVYAEADAADEAKQINNELMGKVLDAVKKEGISEDNIKTQEITLVPKQDNAKNPPETTGYAASNTIILRIRDVKNVGDVIDAAVQAGASVVLPLEFFLLDETSSYQEALAAAVKDVYAKAQLMADAAGLAIEGPLYVREDYDLNNSSPNVLLYEDAVPIVRDAQEDENETAAAVTPIQAGQLTVRAQVTAEFSVKWPIG